MIQVWAVYLRGLLVIKRRFIKTLISIVLSPLLYAVAFGWGLGGSITVEGVGYLSFMLPGLISLSGMNQSFSIGTEINIARFLNKFFEEFLLSPSNPIKIVTGFVLHGMTKGLASFAFILGIGAVLGAKPNINPLIIIPVLLNCFCFASLGVYIALLVKTHRDMNAFTSFIIFPMSFIAGTFFSIRKLPGMLKFMASTLPLTQASLSIRGYFLGRDVQLRHILFLLIYGGIFFTLAANRVRKAVD